MPMIILFVRAIVISIIAGLALAAVLLSLTPNVAPVIDSIPQATRSTAPFRVPTILAPIAEKILGLPVRL